MGLSRDQAILRAMLESMVGVGGQLPDKLISVTRPLTGAYYFIPSAELLASVSGEALARSGASVSEPSSTTG